MRGVISPKLAPFIEQANSAITEAKANNIAFSPTLIRENLEKLAVFIGQGPNVSLIKDVLFKTKNHNIPARIYHPAPEKELPVLLHFHGGGHMCGNVNLYDPISRKLAQQSNCIVICVEYRLAPEYPYPAGVNDCQYVLQHYQDVLNGLNFGDEIYILGDSAGGAICSTLAMNSLSNSELKIDKQILIYPSVDYTMTSASIEQNGQGFLLESSKIHWYFQQYFQSEQLNDEQIKSASPLYGPFSSELPDTLVITAGCDPLRDEGIAYVNSLNKVGAKVKHHQFEGMTHAFMLLNSLVEKECAISYQLISDFIN